MSTQQVSNTISTPIRVNDFGASTGASAGGTAVKKSTSLGKDDFLKILMTQLKYQDPMSPADPSQFMSQLSQLTQVEQLQNMADSLESLKLIAQRENPSEWLSAIGKKMGVADNAMSLGDQIYITPAATDYDSVTLILKSQTDGGTKEVTFNKGDALTYKNETGDTYLAGAVAKKDGKAITCSLDLYRAIRGVQSGDSGLVLVAGDGKTYAASDVKIIKE
jgi:flagellar hook assembly protein FlgD